MHAVGGWLGWLVWWLAPDYRKRFKDNAERAGFTPAAVPAGHCGGRRHGSRVALAVGPAAGRERAAAHRSMGWRPRTGVCLGRAQGRDHDHAARRLLGDPGPGGRRALCRRAWADDGAVQAGAQDMDGRTDRRLARPPRPADAADQRGRRARADAHAAQRRLHRHPARPGAAAGAGRVGALLRPACVHHDLAAAAGPANRRPRIPYRLRAPAARRRLRDPHRALRRHRADRSEGLAAKPRPQP